nr:peptidylprolyl isomerase [Schwartzia sp. (in: firmicutes)]
MKKLLLIAAAVMLCVGAVCFASKIGGETKVTNRIAVFTTNMGTFEIELAEGEAPQTPKNLIDLAEKGFYD